MQFRDVFAERWLTLSNALSFGRMLLLPFFFLVSARYVADPGDAAALAWLCLIIFLAVITDFLDGLLARAWGQETKLGRYLDPVSDKVTSLGALTVLVLYFDFPIWIFGFLILREILGVWMGTFLYFKRDMQGKPNLWGKLGVGLTALTVLWYVLAPHLAARLPPGHFLLAPVYAAYALALVFLIGMVQYGRTYWKVILHGPEGATPEPSADAATPTNSADRDANR